MIPTENKKPKRILIFSLAYLPHVAGAEVAVKEITDRLNPAEFSCDMVTLRFTKNDLSEEKIANLTIYRKRWSGLPFFLQKVLFPFTAFAAALRLHRKNHYDLVWSIMASYAGFAAVFFKYCFPKVSFLLTIQEGENFGRRKVFRFLFKRIFRRADRIQVISNFLADWARKMGAVCPIEVVPNGVSLRNFQKPIDNNQKKEMKERFGFKEDDVVLITTSRLVPKNRVGDVVEAMKFLPENVKFSILGIGHLESSLKSLVTSSKLETRVRFVGFVNHSDLPSYLHSADIFIRTPISEGFGVSYVEAMAAGLPVIATPVGGIEDFIRDPSTGSEQVATGLFTKVGDPKDIADKISRLINNKVLRDRLVANASKMVSEKYDWNLVAQNMADILSR
ncbi:MAG: hypothetical protein A2836_02100 [Candidatus Taylorbacteria bacterium RIFCSPHIGHO2_01_FULL_45_63]|uniref:Glycosyl transferase family 1 domain-containing protein n=1 Tax=Candidatus Taylorbacteria bacterium RIFCSPHIGHO2_02_FULL_45_35 TaxID=1802311 RepID=A0A1G2MWT4_9BACT|nr:MAG: hypothetical protein A2836_02100 [Candidatus Taylorbacteria bacterium RIFCSPHIGHO2_01_FULL_45_63]OHA27401.1 MAG: hypothetical protein A3D56_03865 [Candidatus Taylorbacteria bacterium RIFCSPHIGHO2_02_FULL_45_35]OHA34264.1 MAG: hypothetical protein A3A22_01255 [Candidatus Taylorbacteria bacterium RIFCSPLOWO2_01_FULL_45_34b]